MASYTSLPANEQRSWIMKWMESLPRPTKTYHSDTYDRIAKQHNFDGQGKTALITGGASGVGLTITRAFAEANVARIVSISRSVESQEKTRAELEKDFPSVKYIFYQASVTDYEKLENILKEVGSIDILILNAALAHRRADATDISAEEVRDAFEVNAVAPFVLTKSYLAMPMPASGFRTIINISAGAAHMPGFHRVGYGPSKAAGHQIMQNFAQQFKDKNVRVFSFHPGSYYTPGVAANIPKDAIQWDGENLAAHFARWLAGPESDFLHGRFLWAHWDVDELIELKEKLEKDPNFMTIGLVVPPME